MESFLFGILGGFIAWVTTEIFVRPLTRFFALRAEAAEALALYEDRFNPDPDAPPPNSEWLAQRKLAYEHCGAGLVAFATSNSFISRLVYRVPLKNFRYRVRSAGSNMQGLAETAPGTQASDYFRTHVVSALKLWYWPRGQKPRRRWLQFFVKY